MSDISTVWNTTRGDWVLAGADLLRGQDIVTAVLISLFTDRAANPDDVLTDGSNDPRGWWGQADVGSRLWLLDRAKKTQATLSRAQGYIEECLQWLIDDGVASRIDITVEWNHVHTLAAQVVVYAAGDVVPILKLNTQDVFQIGHVEAWGWNPDTDRGVWVPIATRQQQLSYYTSILYPILVQDTLSVGVPGVQRGYLIKGPSDTLSVGVPGLQSGTLAATISFKTYDGTTHPDTLSVPVPSPQSGTLVVTISYNSYDGTTHPDTLSVPVPGLQSGTLAVTISYVTYSRFLTFPDTLSVPVPTLRGGTLA